MSLSSHYRRRGANALTLATLALPGCLDENPSFDGPASTTALTGTSAPGSTGATSSSPGPSTGSDKQTTADTTGLGSSSSTDATTAALTSTAQTTSEELTGATTGAPLSLEVLADQAGCYARDADGVLEAWTQACEEASSQVANNSEGELNVDGENDDFNGHESRGALRFPWPAELDGAQLLTLELRLVITDHQGSAEGDSTGDIWSSEPFDLTAQQPMNEPALSEQLALSQADAGLDEVFTWALPPSAWAEGEALHLQIVPVSTDGVHFWNLSAPAGEARPRLQITYSE